VGVEEHRRRRLDGCSLDDETMSPSVENVDGVGVEVDTASAGAGLHRFFDGAPMVA